MTDLVTALSTSHTSGDGTYQRYQAAVDRTHQLIERSRHRSANREEARRHALLRMGRLRALLHAMGNPESVPAYVHVAGTSGKGSTATAIASVLTLAGYRTGLHTSPYLQAATEKLQIDGKLIGGDAFAELVDAVLAVVADVPEFSVVPITYGELWVAMTFAWFAQEQIDIAVLETGAGGRFDLTNVVLPIASVITSIGYDHLETLGPTLKDIAWHKSGIIKSTGPVITGIREPELLAIIAGEAELQGTRVVSVEDQSIDRITSGIATGFQRDNARLAVATVRELGRSGFPASDQEIARALAWARIPGRVERMQSDPLVIIDGAHNPQKIGALAGILDAVAPRQSGSRRIAVFGALEAKNSREMLSLLLHSFDHWVLTAPQVVAKQAASTSDLAATLREIGYEGAIDIRSDPLEAIGLALNAAGRNDRIVVTGSMYLAGNIRERWHKTRDIVLQQTPWPGPADSDANP